MGGGWELAETTRIVKPRGHRPTPPEHLRRQFLHYILMCKPVLARSYVAIRSIFLSLRVQSWDLLDLRIDCALALCH